MQKLELTNCTSKPLKVHVEINPDLYVLQPEDVMVIEGGIEPGQPYFAVNVCEDGIQVYPPLWPRVSINGNDAKPVSEPVR